MTSRFEGKTVLVTGGSTGLGFGAAERFIAEGAQVVITARRSRDLEAAVERLGDHAVPVPADVTKDEDLDRLFAAIRDRFGTLDVVVANAGGPFFGTIENYTHEALDSSFSVNLKALAFTVQKALPLMPDGSAVVLMSSIEGERGTAGLGAYAAMKAAAQSMARTWASELAPRRIRVNSISPGVIYTRGYENVGVSKESMNPVIPLIPAGRLGEPSESAAAIAFLASDDASFVNGTNLVVDGGQTEIV